MKDLISRMQSEDKFQIQNALEDLARRLPTLSGPEFEEAVHAVAGLFYIDPMDHPELLPVMERAEDLLADQRERVIPVLLGSLGETDLESHFHLAAVFGKIGYAAVGPLLDAYGKLSDTYDRVFVLYALGKIKAVEVLDALPTLFEAVEDPNPEIRDTAARALGKVCEHVSPDKLDDETRKGMFRRLMDRVSDRFAGVRSKAVRSLGKMARFGLLSKGQKKEVSQAVDRILGEDEAGNWDVAYIVRAEARKARVFLD